MRRIGFCFFICLASLGFAQVELSKEMKMHFPPALAEGSPLSFSGDPYISPEWIEKLNVGICEASSYYERSIAVNFHARRHNIDLKIEGSRMDRTTWGGFNPAYFDYEFVGKTDHDIYVLKTSDCGGGSGHFITFLFLAFEKDVTFLHGELQERILIRKIGETYMGDRWSGRAEVIGNTLHIGPGSWWCGGDTHEAYEIDLSPLRPSKLASPDYTDVTSWNALHVAVEFGLAEDVEPLIALGAEINRLNPKGQTPLIASADRYISEFEEVGLFLLEKGADPHVIDHRKRSALHYACWRFPKLARRLVEMGVDVNQIDEEKETPLTLAEDESLALFLLDEGADPHHIGQYQRSVLYHVCDKFPILTRRLIEAGVDVNQATEWGTTPLMKVKDVAIAKLLIEKGADIHALDESKRSALHCASQDNLELTKLLVEAGADVNRVDKNGATPLSFANEDIAFFLLENGADPHCEGWSILHRSASHGWHTLTQTLIEKGVPINQASEEGVTPLMAAALHEGQDDMLFFLLEKGADPHLQDQHNQTALHYALKGNYNPRFTCHLIDQEIGIHQAGEKDVTPIELALKHENREIAERLFQKGAHAPEHCLHNAIVSGSLEIAKDIVLRGATPSGGNLGLCVYKGQIEILKFLLDQWGYVERGIIDALQAAIEDKSLEVVKLLLEKGANPNGIYYYYGSDFEWTPLDIAYSMRWTEGIKVLREAGGKCYEELP